MESTGDLEAAVRLVNVCRRNAEYFLALGRGADPTIGFDATGVDWLDGFIEQSRPHLTDELRDEFVDLAGCFYGECLIAALGGTWARSGGKVGIRLASSYGTIPFTAVQDQVGGADGTSIATAFAATLQYFSDESLDLAASA